MKKLLSLILLALYVMPLNAMQQNNQVSHLMAQALQANDVPSTLIRHIRHDNWYSTSRTFHSLNLVNRQWHALLSNPSIFHQMVLQIAEQAPYYDEIHIAQGMQKMRGFSQPAFQQWFTARKQQRVSEEALFAAAQEDNAEKIKELIQKEKVNVNARNKYGKTPLSIAASFGSNNALRELLRHNPDINLPNKDGWTPLKKAADHGLLESVQLLLNAGADVNQEDNEGYTPLLNAYNKPAIAKLLIERGADVNHRPRTHSGFTTLMWAAQDNQLEVIQYLLAAGAHDDVRDDINGHNARDIANDRAQTDNFWGSITAKKCVKLLEEKFDQKK